eukprot:CAMPEP_0113500930 /NCGR_PEP_ID=MMETSP0014_2-20120614/32640_1 /TAXON_ID=2857 /ORGANISM="Nitzschia sp." /LENGTH=323 /DNA_ID=CAMNT_0000395397 /DNA_START=162 /DNA_END=1129 /DNA_ORIENTATION=- /assembly_acc=CAM_ASM_000159
MDDGAAAETTSQVDPTQNKQQQEDQEQLPPQNKKARTSSEPQNSSSSFERIVVDPSSSSRSSSSSTDMFLVGKTALVTGGGGTIGRAIAKTLLGHGANVILTARRIEKLEEAKAELLQGLSASTSSPMDSITPVVNVIASDISKEDSVIDLFKEIDRFHDERQAAAVSSSSSIDLLINNAGCNVAGTLEEITASDMEMVLGVNVTGAFLCAREAIKRMRKTNSAASSSSSVVGGGGGRIINIGSISSQSPRPNSVTYTTSKFAIQGLTKSLAVDTRRDNIAVGIIHPGNVVSDMLSEEDVKARGETEGFIQADDVAQCVLTMA